MDLETAVAYFKAHEGVVPWPYLDIRGLVTIGVGAMIPDALSMQALPLVDRSTKQIVGNPEKSLAWEAVHKQPAGKAAEFYRQFTTVELAGDQIDSLLLSKIAAFEAVLLKRFPKFETIPDPAQLGCLDMVYSLGPGGLFNGFPHFCASVDSEDWLSCAEECRRGGVSDQRNADCAQLFKSASGVHDSIPT